MYRKNKNRFSILGSLMIVLLAVSSCSSGKNMDISIQIDKSQYLDIGRLTPKEEEGRTTYTITYGKLTEKVFDPSPQRHSQPVPVTVHLDAGSMTFVGYEASASYGNIQKGDALARVQIEVDSADILEAQLKLQRTQERYERAKAEYEKQHQKKAEANRMISDGYLAKTAGILLERDALEWTETARMFEEEVKKAQEEYDLIKQGTRIETIVAPIAGSLVPYINQEEEEISPGTKLKDGDVIGNIYFSEPKVYFAMEDFQQTYRYGMEFVWDFGNQTLIPGRMVSGNRDDLYGNLDKIPIYFELDADKEKMFRLWGGKMTSEVIVMEQVLLVPVEAVSVEDGVPYVTVVRPDGSLIKTGFTAGGSNQDYYWVLSGLSEGDVILQSK